MKGFSKAIVGLAFCSFVGVTGSAYADCVFENHNWVTANGGCQDIDTGLVWSVDQSLVTGTSFTYDASVRHCDESTEGGYSDWRLPAKDELVQAAANGAVDALDSADDYILYHFHWSITDIRKGGRKRAYAVKLSDGETTSFSKATGTNIFCVR